MPQALPPQKIPIRLDSSWIMEGTILAQQEATTDAVKREAPVAQATPPQVAPGQPKPDVEMADATVMAQQSPPLPSNVAPRPPPRKQARTSSIRSSYSSSSSASRRRKRRGGTPAKMQRPPRDFSGEYPHRCRGRSPGRRSPLKRQRVRKAGRCPFLANARRVLRRRHDRSTSPASSKWSPTSGSIRGTSLAPSGPSPTTT